MVSIQQKLPTKLPSSGSRGGAEGAMAPPGPVKIGHKKDGRQRRPHRFHVSRPPPYPAAGSATVTITFYFVFHLEKYTLSIIPPV